MGNDFRPGFRFSILDAFIILAGSLFVALLFANGIYFPGVMVVVVVGHFFLFCNVFRIRRRSELIWATVTVLLSNLSIFIAVPTAPVICGAVVAITVLLAAYFIFLEIRTPSYHGIFWEKWNPNLKSWWGKQHPPHDPPK